MWPWIAQLWRALFGGASPTVKTRPSGIAPMGNTAPLANPAQSFPISVALPGAPLAYVVANVAARDLFPAKGQVDLAIIDQWKAAADAVQPGVPLEVRLFFGAFAPSWLLAEGSVTLTNPLAAQPHAAPTLTVPRFWTAAYQAAVAGCIAALGAALDPDPRIAIVTVSPCGTVTGEQMNIPHTPEDVAALTAAGATDAAIEAAIASSYAPFAAAFPTTNLSMVFSRLPGLTAAGAVNWVTALAQRFVADVGPRAVVANQALPPDPAHPAQAAIVTALATLAQQTGCGFEAQFHGHANQTLANAQAMKALGVTACEYWPQPNADGSSLAALAAVWD